MRSAIFFLRDSEFRTQLFLGGLGSVFIKVANLLLTVSVTIVLARILGTDGYGVYAYIFAIVQILCVPAQLGFPVLAVREISAYVVNKSWGHIAGFLRFGTLVVAVGSIVLVVLSASVVWQFSDNIPSSHAGTLLWGLFLLPMIALGAFRGAVLRGLQHVVKGQLPEFIVRQAGLLILLLSCWILLPGIQLMPNVAIALHAIAAWVAFVVGGYLIGRYLPEKVATAPKANESARWIRSGMSLSLVAGMQIFNSQTDIIMLGVFADDNAVGIYRVSVQAALLVAFGLQIIKMVVAPQFSRLFVSGDMERLARLAVIGARLAFALALPLAILFSFFGGWILANVFGSGFEAGQYTLSIMCIGQVINAAMGSVAVVLYMTNHESTVVRMMLFSAIVNVVLNYVLIPVWGMEGAAAATAFTMVLRNLMLLRSIQIKYGFTAWAFANIKNLRLAH